MRASAALLALAPLLIGASEPVLIPDVSDQKIDIVYSFTGAELLLFGAILYPRGRTPERPPDIAVVIKGPSEHVLLREKAKVGGIWVNHASAGFRDVPSFYAVATSWPIDELVDEKTAITYQIGVDNLRLTPDGRAPARDRARFEHGLVALRRQAGLYTDHPGAVSIREGVLYRASVPIPARVPVGRYTAETFLIRDGRVIAAASRTIDIDKTGFERFVASAAWRWPLGYGLVAVGLALALGWAAAMIGRRRGR